MSKNPTTKTAAPAAPTDPKPKTAEVIVMSDSDRKALQTKVDACDHAALALDRAKSSMQFTVNKLLAQYTGGRPGMIDSETGEILIAPPDAVSKA